MSVWDRTKDRRCSFGRGPYERRSTPTSPRYVLKRSAPLPSNLIVAVDSGVNDGDKPSRSFLQKLGLPDPAIRIVAESRNWSSGCGFYNFGDANGNISVSIVAGDKRLDSDRLKDCIISGILFSFGLRAKTNATIDTSKFYLQYLLLASALRFCENKLKTSEESNSSAERLQDAFVDCAAARIEELLRQ